MNLKKWIISFLLLSCTFSVSFSQDWFYKDLSDHIDNSWATYFTSSSTGFLVGFDFAIGTNKGKVLKTTNNGTSWESVFENGSHTFNDIYFFNENKGFTSGSAGGLSTAVCRTADGGGNWECEDLNFYNLGDRIYFIDNSNGFIVGARSTGTLECILKTTDGGVTWTDVSPVGVAEAVYGINFINSNTGFAVGGNALLGAGRVYKTTDGGNSWTETFQDEEVTFWDVYFLNSNNGFLIGSGSDGAKLYKTTNGGDTWQLDNNLNAQILRDINFIDAQTGYLSGSGGLLTGSVIYKTTDAGQTWAVDYSNTILSFTFEKIHYNNFGNRLFINAPGGFVYTDVVASGISVLPKDVGIEVYPNPTEDMVFIKSENKTVYTISVYNLLGEKIISKQEIDDYLELNLSNLPLGMYSLLFESVLLGEGEIYSAPVLLIKK